MKISVSAAAVAASVAMLFATPAFAQNSGSSSAGKTQSPSMQSGANPGQMRQQVKKDLEQQGFTQVQVVPNSFVVGAHDKQGRPVMMLINPDGMVAVTQVGSNQGGASASGASSGSGLSASGSQGSSAATGNAISGASGSANGKTSK